MLRHQKNINGFSMLEMVVVIALISILAVVARPSIKSYLETSRLRSATNTIKQQLVLAKTRALGDANKHVGVFLDTSSSQDKSIAFIDDNPDTLNDNQYTSGKDHIFMPTFNLPQSDTLKIITSSNNAIIFRGDGSAKASLKICIINSQKRCDTISVLASTGRIKITRNF